jgi:hypothetical protein
MKTYSQFYQEITKREPFKAFHECEDLAAREYAKQWIDFAGQTGGIRTGVNRQKDINTLKTLIDKQ